MKLVIDSKIPFIEGFAEQLGEVVYLPGASITAADVRDADALIVRTRTRCDRRLLEGSKVKFIATATIGFDHIDANYLKEAGISWTNCPGCNAPSVAQYVGNCLLLLAAHGCWHSDGLTAVDSLLTYKQRQFFATHQWNDLVVGIVGVGHVGSQVLQRLRTWGFKEILCCDPLRAKREQGFVDICEIAERCDIITFHTPLTYSPEPYPTYHMASDAFFSNLGRCPVMINSGRGEVVDTQALKEALKAGKLRAAVIDTWENEPNIDQELLDMVYIGTPHIAGYSADGKACGTRMALQATARFFGMDETLFDNISAPELPADYAYYPQGEAHELHEALCLYDPVRDYLNLRATPQFFEKLRGDYPLRRERR